MKLFVQNKKNVKVYLNINAFDRRHLSYIIGAQTFFLNGENEQFNVNQVIAESGSNDTTAGLLLGGLFGLIGGPAGVLIGGALGGIIGNNSDTKEISKINRFNNSRI
jgi:hypothetical protein